jgi:hypothetical protein
MQIEMCRLPRRAKGAWFHGVGLTSGKHEGQIHEIEQLRSEQQTLDESMLRLGYEVP